MKLRPGFERSIIKRGQFEIRELFVSASVRRYILYRDTDGEYLAMFLNVRAAKRVLDIVVPETT